MIVRMLGLFVLLSISVFGLAPAPQDVPPNAGPAPKLERFVLSCDRIVRASIAGIHEVPAKQPTRVLELQVEEIFWGEPETKVLFVLFVLDDSRYAGLRDHGAPAAGESSIWFLERDPWFDALDSATRECVTKLAGSSPLQVATLWGAGRVPIERKDGLSLVCLPKDCWWLPDKLEIVGAHTTTSPKREWSQVRESEFERWLRASIPPLVPGLEVRLLSNGPGDPLITIDKQGHARRSGSGRGDDKQLEIGPEGLQKILSLAEREHFFDLPAELGRSLGPDSAVYLLRIRTEKGSREIRLCGPVDPKQDSPAILEAHARAMRIWDAIPLARDWKITGH
jgi:hypothetical protein